jgi:serine/threonine protein phosphatase 1
MRTLAIGDIHGCHTALEALLHAVKLQREDRIVFLGDYIDRGPASRQVIDTFLTLEKRCRPIFVRGNHEVMLLAAREDDLKFNLWQSYGGVGALQSYGTDRDKDWVSAMPEPHWQFFESTAAFHETDTLIFVHACLDADLDMEEQPEWLLYWELFDRIQPHKSGKQIVCGHTPQKSGEIKSTGFAVCIDTGAVYGGWLTCLDTATGDYWQANENRDIRTGHCDLATSL